MDRAKLFMSGHSQAVRLPKAFRFEGREVSIRREGQAVILEPIKVRQWPKHLWERILVKDASFERPKQGQVSPIPSLDSDDE